MAGTVTAFYNEEAEKSILATIAVDRDGAKLIPQLTAADFYPQQHRQMFEAIQRLYIEKREIDLVTISEKMREMFGPAEAQLTEALVEILNRHEYRSSWAVKSHVEIIHAAALRRRMMEIIEGAKAELTDETNETEVVLDRTRQALRDIIVTGHKWHTIEEVLIDTYGALERRAKGLEPSMPSGVSSLDRTTTGFHRGEVTIIGARPSVGKSALGAHIAMNTAAQGYKVAICSREMTDVQYGTRIITRGTNVESSKLRTGEIGDDDWGKIGDALLLYSQLNLSFMFSTRYIEDLRMEVQRKVDAGELDMLVVDYIQLMQTKQKFDKDYLRIAHISKTLKDMAVDFNISIISLAQVGRASEGSMPTLAELRGSGDLEQDADNVIFMHRPISADDKFVRPQDRELFYTLQEAGMQYIALNIAKQRQGGIGAVPIVFDPAHMRFTAIDRRE